jgi:hypothetical protein
MKKLFRMYYNYFKKQETQTTLQDLLQSFTDLFRTIFLFIYEKVVLLIVCLICPFIFILICVKIIKIDDEADLKYNWKNVNKKPEIGLEVLCELKEITKKNYLYYYLIYTGKEFVTLDYEKINKKLKVINWSYPTN